jgi:hypothetical protein
MVECTLFFRKQATSIYVFYGCRRTLKYNNFIPQSQGIMHLSMLTPRGGGGRAYVGYLIISCIPTLGILISILAPSWGNLNRMTFINIVFIAIYCKMVGHLTNSYCPTVGHLIENLLKKSNAPPMPDPPGA